MRCHFSIHMFLFLVHIIIFNHYKKKKEKIKIAFQGFFLNQTIDIIVECTKLQ